jgi:hypothetical protein
MISRPVHSPNIVKSIVFGLSIIIITAIIIIIIIIFCFVAAAAAALVSYHRPFLPGTSLEPPVTHTAQASSFTLQYFPYYV